jgi:uncharacterized protein (DUF4415 family)
MHDGESTLVGKKGVERIFCACWKKWQAFMDAARINPLNPEQEGKNMARRLAPLKPQLHDFFLEHVHAPLVDAFSEFSNRETVSAVPLPEQIELLKTHVANKKKVLIRSQEDEINAIRQKGKAWRDEIDKIRRGLA